MNENQRRDMQREEGIIRRFQLFKYMVGVVVLGVVLGGWWLQHKAKKDYTRNKESAAFRAKIRQDGLIRFINNPTVFDAYGFSANKILSTGEATRNVNLSANVISFDRLKSSCIFQLPDGLRDTVVFSKADLIRISENDTIDVLLNSDRFLLNGINSHTRGDGLRLRIFSLGKSDVNFGKRKGNLTITSVESITGQAQVSGSLPLNVENDRFTIEIVRADDVAEFVIKGQTDFSKDWSRRVLISEWDSFLFFE